MALIWASDMTGKGLTIWFLIMGFVAIRFQQDVANMFVILAVIFAGYYSWGDYLAKFVSVYLWYAVGGGVFAALIYWISYTDSLKKSAAQFQRQAQKMGSW